MAKKPKKDMGILEVEKLPRVSAWAWLRARFFAGMVIALPIVVTFAILQFFINYIDQRVVPFLPESLRPETYLNYAVPGFGVIVLVLFLTILGAITTNLLGRSVVVITDRVLSQIPIVRTVYSSFKQLVDVFANFGFFRHSGVERRNCRTSQLDGVDVAPSMVDVDHDAAYGQEGGFGALERGERRL